MKISSRPVLRFLSGLSILFFSLFLTLPEVPGFSVEMTPELIFTQMEERSDKILSLITDVDLRSGERGVEVTLSIQSPDKFSMDFKDTTLQVVFDGEKLWIYIGSLNEVFTLDTSSSGNWVADALRDYVNPKKIVTQVTRKTLFAFFDVTLVSSGTAEIPVGQASPTYRLSFVPRGQNLFKKIFDVGHYEMTFGSDTFLPRRVDEYTPDGALRGTLEVLSYRLNEEIPKERFEFKPPPGTKEVPITEVIVQKIDQGKDLMVEKLGDLLEHIKKKISDWGI